VAKYLNSSILGKTSAVFVQLVMLLFLGVSFSFAKEDLKVPSDYGDVIYRCNTESPNQLFIIGLSHRDTLTRQNGTNTPKIQAEVYKIGDWLIHQQGCELLLPEGFFKSPAPVREKERDATKPVRDDMKSLEERLADNRVYVNAEMLLKEDHSLRTQQVEDKVLYDAVGAGLRRLISGPSNPSEYLLVKTKLDYLQERRTAAMLQKIPDVIDHEFQGGFIKSRKAIFTIGLSHLQKIIQYLSTSRITVFPPSLPSEKEKDYVAELDLLKKNFGVSIILPKTLAEDQKALEASKLEKIVTRYQGTPLPGHPTALP
jgi:hypothetical protein